MLKAWRNVYHNREKSPLKEERDNRDENHVKEPMLEDVGRAIKLLLQYGLSEEKIRSECWVAQDLCHRLDLALRHGLRRPTAGYWPYVRHFTHTDNVKMLEKSCSRRRATLDKSRAWLYHSLNEGSLEGYLRTFTREGNLLGKHYFKYALMRDEQRRDLLLGLLASIQDISFELALQSFDSMQSSINSLPSPEDSGVANVDSDLSEPLDSLGDQDDDTATLNELEDNRIYRILSMDSEKVVLRTPKRDPQRHLKRVSFHEEQQKEFFNKRHSWCVESSISSSTLSLPYDERGLPEGEETPIFDELHALHNKLELIKHRRKLFLKKAAMSKKKQPGLRLYLPGATANVEACKELEQQIAREVQLPREVRDEDEDPMYLDERLLEILRKDIFDHPSEKILKVFKGYGPLAQPGISPLLVIITNAGIYAICHSDSKIKPKFSCNFHQLNAILFGPGGQTVMFATRSNGKHLISLSDCSESAPAMIISSIELAMRKLQLELAAWRRLDLSEMTALQRSLSRMVPSLTGEKLIWQQVVHVQDSSRQNSATEAVREGLLMMRIGTDGPWLPSYLVLRDCELWVFGDELDHEPQLVVGVSHCVACGRVQLSERPYTFEIQCGRSSLPLQLAAADEYEVSEWLQALLQAACGQSQNVHTSKLQLCSLVLSNGHLLAYRLDRSAPEPVCCTQLMHVTAIRAAESTWCALEFECAEAKENGGDWILYFDTVNDRAEFFHQMEKAWAKLPQDLSFPCTNFVSDLLLQRCEEASVHLMSSWNPLINFG